MRIFAAVLCGFLSATLYAQTLTPVTVALDWYMNPDHAPLLVAEEKGYFAAEGLDVHFISPTETSEPEKLVALNQAQIAISYPATLARDTKAGMPIEQFAVLINHPLTCVTVLATSSIHSMADLKGKKLGYPTSSSGFAILKQMLAYNHVALNQVDLINVKMNLVQALLSHQVDAVSGMMRTVEPIEMAAMGVQTRLFFPEDNGVPNYDELILITNLHNVNTPWLKGFVAALQKGVDDLRAHPEADWQLTAKTYVSALAPTPEMAKTNHAIWMATVPYFASTS